MRIAVLQHEIFEGPGMIRDYAAQRGHTLSIHMVREDGAAYPDIADVDLLAIMGGTMSVRDIAQDPAMTRERDYIRDYIREGKAAFGICLGAQLIASALGGAVIRHDAPEVGWRTVQADGTAQHHPMAHLFHEDGARYFQWHEDTFSVPEGAVRVARNRHCRNQAFAYRDNVLALQFHPEATAEGVCAFLQYCKELPPPGDSVQSKEEILRLSPQCEAPARRKLYAMLEMLENRSV